MSTHTCPCGCGTQVTRNRLACRVGWYRLPKAIRDAVWAGYKAAPLGEQHTAALADALDWYRAN